LERLPRHRFHGIPPNFLNHIRHFIALQPSTTHGGLVRDGDGLLHPLAPGNI
jgi:hypothetical protein